MKEEFSFLSSNGENNIHGVRWIPEGEIKGIVQILHGMCEYIERYEDFAGYLNSMGILVTGHDHLGHGHSVESEDGLGYFAKKNGADCTLEDAHTVTKLTKELYPKLPYVLLGHSMGSYIASNYIERFGSDLDAAILVGTGLEAPIKCLGGKALCNIVSLVKGDRHRSRLLYNIMFGAYNKRIKDNKTRADWICTDDKIVEKYLADPLCNYTFTVNGNITLINFTYYETRAKHLDNIPKQLPIYLTAGNCDPVGHYGKSVLKVEKMFKKHGVKDVSVKLYPGMRHEILNEIGKEKVYEDIYEWIGSHTNLKKA